MFYVSNLLDTQFSCYDVFSPFVSFWRKFFSNTIYFHFIIKVLTSFFMFDCCQLSSRNAPIFSSALHLGKLTGKARCSFLWEPEVHTTQVSAHVWAPLSHPPLIHTQKKIQVNFLHSVKPFFFLTCVRPMLLSLESLMIWVINYFMASW